jgi:hypothetical protein
VKSRSGDWTPAKAQSTPSSEERDECKAMELIYQHGVSQVAIGKTLQKELGSNLDLSTYAGEVLKPFSESRSFSRIAMRSRLTKLSSQPLGDHALLNPAASMQ